MCFSAEVSFGSAAIITTVGVIAYKKAKNKPQKLLAIIPMIFGAQQFSEGFVWLASTYDLFSWVLQLSSYFFIIFAWIIWPIYIPYTLWRLEKKMTRKEILYAFAIVGCFVTAILIYVLFKYNLYSQIQDNSVQYKIGISSPYVWIISSIYFGITTLSHFISSVKKMWILGALNLVTFFFSRIYFNEYFISVWCFFAALSSLAILWIITSLNKEETESQ